MELNLDICEFIIVMMQSLVLALLMAAPPTMDYRSRAGMLYSAADVPLVQGSFFQFYEPGFVKGYYSSNWNEQNIKTTEGAQEVTFTSSDKLASGRIVFTKTASGMTADYSFKWDGPKLANLELSYGHLWAPALESGTVTIDGKEQRKPSVRFPVSSDPKPRMFGEGGKSFVFSAPIGKVQVDLEGVDGYVFDARGYTGDFALGKELFWLGSGDIPLEPGKEVKFRAMWTITPRETKASASEPMRLTSATLKGAFSASEGPMPLAPKPQSIERTRSRPFVWDVQQLASVRQLEQATLLLNDRFDLRSVRSGKDSITLTLTDLKLPKGGYTLEAGGGLLKIHGQDQEGLRNGILRAVQLTKALNGQLVIPATEMKDWPVIDYRGVHMYVGPESLSFQTKLMNRMLAPMGLNQVVLQCERTDWKATPEIKAAWTMSREDLVKLFKLYRDAGIEPTPLIQSFGHMGWLFMNGQNKDLAFNPDVLFAVDPRKPRTREVLTKIWDEAIALLEPKKIHFGLDEVSMRGFPTDPAFVTGLWNEHVPFLADLAKKHEKPFMIWGDKLLAPGEAPDATNGGTKAEAAKRRSVVPKGSYIADWHYINNDNPGIYKSLEILKNDGLKPIASTWNRPENIKGFFKAAELAGAGALQTTWAGYTSTEDNMLRESSQLVAYALAAEYAWSGRTERAAKLPYSPEGLVRRSLYDLPLPVRPVTGRAWRLEPKSQNQQIGPYLISTGPGLPFYSPLSDSSASSPRSRSFVLNAKAKQIVLAVGVSAPLSEFAEIGEVTITLAGGKKFTKKIRYGTDVIGPNDKRQPIRSAWADGKSAFVMNLGDIAAMIANVEVKVLAPVAGLKLYGLTTL
jgi:hypothetical protein